MPNYNPNTGIAYGVIAVNSLSEEIQSAIYEDSIGWDCPELDAAYKNAQRDRFNEMIDNGEIVEDDLPADADLEDLTESQISDLVDEFDPYFDQTFYDGVDEGEFRKHGTIHDDFGDFKVSMVNLGGAPLLWIEDSPITVHARPCSPCIPGAGDLNALYCEENGPPGFGHYIQCYAIPECWYARP